MGGGRVAASLNSLRRICARRLTTLPPSHGVGEINGSSTSYDCASLSPRRVVRSSLFPAAGIRNPQSTLEAATRFDSELRRPAVASLINQRLAGSHPSLVSTSGRARACCYEQRCSHTSGQDFEGKEKISVTFFDKDGEETEIRVPVGMSMLEAAHENDIELEGDVLPDTTLPVFKKQNWKILPSCCNLASGGARGAEIRSVETKERSTQKHLQPEVQCQCNVPDSVVLDTIEQEEEMYSKLPEPSDEENDMLDLAFGLTETSRLGCQVIAKPELDGLRLALPAATRNFAVDGHVPKPH